MEGVSVGRTEIEGVSVGMEPLGLSSVLVCVGTITSIPLVRSLTKDPMEASWHPRVPSSLGIGCDDFPRALFGSLGTYFRH